MHICAPTNFDLNILNRLQGRIHETYGNLNLAGEDIISGSTRPEFRLAGLRRYVEHSHGLGIEFNYILNHPGILPSDSVGRFLEELLKLKVDALTISNPELISFARQRFPFRLCCSVYCRVDSPEKALKYKQL